MPRPSSLGLLLIIENSSSAFVVVCWSCSRGIFEQRLLRSSSPSKLIILISLHHPPRPDVLDRQVSTVEASLRLDSVGSAGMGMSRSKMAAAIKSGLVLVNWKAATSGTTDV